MDSQAHARACALAGSIRGVATPQCAAKTEVPTVHQDLAKTGDQVLGSMALTLPDLALSPPADMESHLLQSNGFRPAGGQACVSLKQVLVHSPAAAHVTLALHLPSNTCIRTYGRLSLHVAEPDGPHIAYCWLHIAR